MYKEDLIYVLEAIDKLFILLVVALVILHQFLIFFFFGTQKSIKLLLKSIKLMQIFVSIFYFCYQFDTF